MNPVNRIWNNVFCTSERTGIPLVKTDVNRTIEILRRSSRVGPGVGVKVGVEVNREG